MDKDEKEAFNKVLIKLDLGDRLDEELFSDETIKSIQNSLTYQTILIRIKLSNLWSVITGRGKDV